MILSAIEKKAYKRGSEEKAKEIFERMIELGFSKDLARKAVYSDSKLSKEQNSQ